MIAKSDLTILVVSASVLAFGIYRWQMNTRPVEIASVQVPANVVTTTELPAPTTRVLGAIETDTTTNDSVSIDARRVIEIPANAISEPIVIDNDGPIASDEQILFSVYTVQSGDYLGSIAQRFDTNVATIRELNGISGSLINVGDELRVPQAPN